MHSIIALVAATGVLQGFYSGRKRIGQLRGKRLKDEIVKDSLSRIMLVFWGVCLFFLLVCWTVREGQWSLYVTEDSDAFLVQVSQLLQYLNSRGEILNRYFTVTHHQTALFGLEWFGTFVGTLGLAFYWRAHEDLTVAWVATKTRAELINWGSYSVVRNPMYLGFLLLFAGLTIGTANLAVFVCSFGLMVSFLTRIQGEETFLQAHFGEQYVEYCSKVPYRVVPGLF